MRQWRWKSAARRERWHECQAGNSMGGRGQIFLVNFGNINFAVTFEGAVQLKNALAEATFQPETGYERQCREERNREQRESRDYGDR